MNKVLIVDDTKINITILLELLSQTYDVMVAKDGQTALQIAQTEKPDVILLDIVMPHMDGFEVCEKLKSQNDTKNIPILFLTAKNDEESIEKAYELGGVDYITKPFKCKELYAKIKRELKLKEFQQKEIEYQKQVSLNTVLKNIKHQWRQPLSCISSSTGGLQVFLEMGMDISQEKLNEHCELVIEQSEYLSNVLNSFEKYFDKSEKEKLSLSVLIDQFLEDIQIDLKRKQIDTVVSIDKEYYLQTQRKQFLEVFHILYNNSKDAFLKNQTDQKKIIIKVFEENNKIKVVFFDNAGGVDEQIIDNIFEPYTTTKHQSLGTGLGLNIVYRFVNEGMGGTIFVQNEVCEDDKKEYMGAKFTLELPLK